MKLSIITSILACLTLTSAFEALKRDDTAPLIKERGGPAFEALKRDDPAAIKLLKRQCEGDNAPNDCAIFKRYKRRGTGFEALERGDTAPLIKERGGPAFEALKRDDPAAIKKERAAIKVLKRQCEGDNAPNDCAIFKRSKRGGRAFDEALKRSGDDFWFER